MVSASHGLTPFLPQHAIALPAPAFGPDWPEIAVAARPVRCTGPKGRQRECSLDATAMLDRAERDGEVLRASTFIPAPVKTEMAYRKPAIEQYPQHNRAARRLAAKMARRKQAKVA